MKVKSNIGFNLAIHGDGMYASFAANAPKSIMCMFSGTPPTAAQLLASADAITGQIDYTKLVNSVPDHVLLAYCFYNELLVPQYKAPDRIAYPLTKAVAQGFAIAAGAPTWFLFASVEGGDIGLANNATGTPEGKTGVKLGLTVLGSVGDENSSADVKIRGGAIVMGTPYKVLDIDVTVTSPA